MAHKHYSIAKLLQDEPLYRKVEIEKYYFHPELLDGITFQFFCPNENSIHTFKLSLAPENIISAVKETEDYRFDRLFDPIRNPEQKSIDIIQHYAGTCQYCNNYKTHFLLHIFSEGDADRSMFYNRIGQPITEEPLYGKPDYKNVKLFLRKLGQWPSFQLKPDTLIYNFLSKEDKDYYNKALVCLSQNYGVAAFAYLRKIVENEIVRIIQEVANSGSGDSEKIKQLLDEYKVKKQTTPLVENIYPYLPSSLKSLDDNPIKLLYSYLSEGLHNHSDEECLGYANTINKLLGFTIKKIREEQNELKEIRGLLSELRNKPNID